ncbi:hypothetical protein ATO8_19949 [Roseivivax marinus]|uniref:Uncharacterized protein n=1 Tax=Roseivivax marinus TaxID=1379903 RepID=W4HG11_9RHOB|nr:hypothetical protein [Roseivivax marinus]ETW10905.1 hypothetical protein ATO8_19949 [Roseivivax marinus]
MTKKREAVVPPPRDPKPAVPATSAVTEGERTPLNLRVTTDRVIYLRKLAATTGRKQYELLERAIDLLREEAGEV